MPDTALFQPGFASQDMSRPGKDNGYFLYVATSLFLAHRILGQIIRNHRHFVHV